MDPNFVQHSLVDISVRFSGYLIFILAFSTAIHGGVDGLFALFGCEVKDTKLDDGVKAGLGITIATLVDLNLFFYVGGITNTQFAQSLAARAADGSPSAWLPPVFAILVCNLITGSMVGGGKRVIVGVAREFGSGYEAIKKAIGNRGNGAQKTS